MKNHVIFALAATLVLGMAGCVTQKPASAKIDLLESSATDITQHLRDGDVSVETYVTALLDHAARHDATLKAFISLDRSYVLAQARAADDARRRGEDLGPLFGVPISLKDLISTKDLPTTFGTQVFNGFTPARDAPLVTKLQDAGAIIFGKNNAQELAFGSNGYNAHYGQQLNPYNVAHVAGGSSGGGVAAVAARMLPIAIGSDTAASIRQPAAYTGLYGLRPSTGRYDNSGVSPLSPTLDTVGPLTRSVDDLVLIDSVLADDFSPLPAVQLDTLRVGVPQAFFHDGVSQELEAAFDAFVQRATEAGVTIVEVDLPRAGELSEGGVYPILFYETYPAVAEFLAQWGNGTTIEALHAGLGWDIKAMWDQLVVPGAPDGIPEAVYRNAVNVLRPAMQAQYADYFHAHKLSAMLFPATAGAAPLATPDNPMETIIDGETVSIFINDHNSSPGALAGQPGIVMPLALNSQGLPIAVSLDGKRDDDRTLLAVARALSNLLDSLPKPVLEGL